MIFYGEYEATKNLKSTPRLDYLEFEFERPDPEFVPQDLDAAGVLLSCDWDESDWCYNPETGSGFFRCKGVCVNSLHANGHMDMFKHAKLDALQIFCPEDVDFRLTELLVADGEERYLMTEGAITPRETIIEHD